MESLKHTEASSSFYSVTLEKVQRENIDELSAGGIYMFWIRECKSLEGMKKAEVKRILGD